MGGGTPVICWQFQQAEPHVIFADDLLWPSAHRARLQTRAGASEPATGSRHERTTESLWTVIPEHYAKPVPRLCFGGMSEPATLAIKATPSFCPCHPGSRPEEPARSPNGKAPRR